MTSISDLEAAAAAAAGSSKDSAANASSPALSVVDEDTLGTSTGRGETGRRRGVPTPKVPRVASSRIISENAGSLGTAFLGTGATTICILLSLFGLARFALQWSSYPEPVFAALAWLLYAALLVGVAIVVRRNEDRLPDREFYLFLVGLAIVVALDLVAIWPLHSAGHYASAAITAGIGLLAVLSVRAAREVFLAVAVLGAVLLVVVLLDLPTTTGKFAADLAAIALAVLPAAMGAVVIRGFRRMIQVELDRVLVQSTVSAPRYAVGMLASEELARLDYSAEQLLEDVASGRTPLPLPAHAAQAAASLATELRLHLIEGRRETWLYHAVSESEFLGRSVTLSDPGSLAGLLDARQRDGLLSAAWLLVSDSGAKPRGGLTLHLTLGPVAATPITTPLRKISIPIVISTTGVPRNRVDPGTWDAIRKVGRHTESIRDGSLHVEVECIVDNPADK